MHAILFSFKRAQHRALHVTRPLTDRFGITPARVDMLIAARRAPIYQSDLRRHLGVTAATTSRMVISLEQLGFVQRVRCDRDRRQLVVRITAVGKCVLRHVMRTYVSSGFIARFLKRTIAYPPTFRNWFADMLDVFDRLDHWRRVLRDHAATLYYWHPDDFSRIANLEPDGPPPRPAGPTPVELYLADPARASGREVAPALPRVARLLAARKLGARPLNAR